MQTGLYVRAHENSTREMCRREADSVPPCQLLPTAEPMSVCVSCGRVSLPRASVLQLWHVSLASLMYNCCVCTCVCIFASVCMPAGDPDPQNLGVEATSFKHVRQGDPFSL